MSDHSLELATRAYRDAEQHCRETLVQAVENVKMRNWLASWEEGRKRTPRDAINAVLREFDRLAKGEE